MGDPPAGMRASDISAPQEQKNRRERPRRRYNTMDVISAVSQEYLRTDIPKINVGDTVKVYIKIVEGSRERVQVFEGFVLKMQNGGISRTFTVRRIASGVGVEKTFPMHSPRIDKIEIVRRSDVRRAKLNYMRQRTGKAARLKAKEVRN
jgi:large subunit ribosomal protein L19